MAGIAARPARRAPGRQLASGPVAAVRLGAGPGRSSCRSATGWRPISCAPCWPASGRVILVAAPDAVLPAALPDGLVLEDRGQFLDEVRHDAAPARRAGPVPGRHRHPAVHQRHDRRAEGRRAAPPPPRVVHHRHRRVPRRRAEDEAALVSVPPYHIAGICAILSSRLRRAPDRVPRRLRARAWVRLVDDERVTHAMVVPTMLGRILDVVEADGERLPSLRHLSYGGGRMPPGRSSGPCGSCPHVDFVNAYGLTETSSTIAVLGPDDHRERSRRATTRPCARRLGSVGRPLPTSRSRSAAPDGEPVGPGVRGEIYVRGEQVAGEYLGAAPADDDGWFPTRDARLPRRGRLPLPRGPPRRRHRARRREPLAGRDRGRAARAPGGRRGGGGRASRPGMGRAGGRGRGDRGGADRGRRRVAAVGAGAAARSRTPTRIEFGAELPYNETGKLLRRKLREQLGTRQPPPSVRSKAS